VGGDHAADSSVLFILPDRVLFLGDCLYDSVYTPQRHYTAQRLLPLLNSLQAFDAAFYVEGHEAKVSTRAEFDDYTTKMREAVQLVEAIGADEEKVFAAAKAKTGSPPDEDSSYFLRALISGLVVPEER
jgi:glyoxylase-like metal-dependent hydrolase (beta-lactamase superfamily II)